MRKIGLPHNMPVSTRGLLRTNVVLTDDDTDEDVQPALAAAPESAALSSDDPITVSMTVTPDYLHAMSEQAAEVFEATVTS